MYTQISFGLLPFFSNMSTQVSHGLSEGSLVPLFSNMSTQVSHGLSEGSLVPLFSNMSTQVSHGLSEGSLVPLFSNMSTQVSHGLPEGSLVPRLSLASGGTLLLILGRHSALQLSTCKQDRLSQDKKDKHNPQCLPRPFL